MAQMKATEVCNSSYLSTWVIWLSIFCIWTVICIYLKKRFCAKLLFIKIKGFILWVLQKKWVLLYHVILGFGQFSDIAVIFNVLMQNRISSKVPTAAQHGDSLLPSHSAVFPSSDGSHDHGLTKRSQHTWNTQHNGWPYHFSRKG